MSNTTPGPGEEHIDGTEPTNPAANEDSSQNTTREYDAPLAPAIPADEYAPSDDSRTDAAAPVSEEFDPDAFRDSVPAEDTAPDRAPAEPVFSDATADTDSASAEHHHVPEIADEAYSEPADTHVVSSSEPTVLTQADLREEQVRAEEADRAVYSDSSAPVVPAPAAGERQTSEPERAPEPQAPPAPMRQPVYVQAPSEPKPKGNRGFGILVSLLATVVFAVLYAAVLALLLLVNLGNVDIVGDVLVQAPFWIPVIFFFLGMVLLVSVVNRGGWWAYVLGGFVVAAIVYGSYLGGVLIEQAAEIAPSQVGGVVQRALLSPAAVISFVIAREVPIWFGAWVASRGRKVRERNAEAQREYQRILDQGPVLAS
ncbi:hypothetical protein D9V29_05800 [Mycetocola manganoxydans]|uniref:Uncharacterized protein n=1 Tax=Mycetocola manganoxydans TaxID=699879 RepID=A0A3L6ZVM3_9MICO|nr:hypothetical protein [Mycetocola manganoxydans]RLP71947.1 hypothetical protein D9V29_05800 [Mycetocola manganoxydans]GHD47236.1 hypothetical protein GCM10008097_17920 [Mycetocola manganoxydans]